MKKLLFLIINIAVAINASAYDVSGIATDAESGEPLSGIDILLTYSNGGVASSTLSHADGSFTLTGVTNGTYNLEFYTYPDPIILNGDYFLRTIYQNPIIISDANITGIFFEIPPHHPKFVVTGTLYDANSNQPLINQTMLMRLKMMYYSTLFYTNSTEDGTYMFEGIPDWTYDFTIYENDFYMGEVSEITIDSLSQDTVHMDFYLQPKNSITVSGQLRDSVTNDPILEAGRTIVLQAINSLYTQTNSDGKFMFANVDPGYYANIHVSSQDTDYVNCSQSKIDGFFVPDTGINNVVLYQKPWISIHKVTADDYTFEPGMTKTVTFSLVLDDLSYGSIFGVELQMPSGVTVLNTTPFKKYGTNESIFDRYYECSYGGILDWEGWHIVDPPYGPVVGNLENLNDSVYSEVQLQFADSSSMMYARIFYEVYYAVLCNIQPFSYGNIMMVNDNIFTGFSEKGVPVDRICSFPNPAGEEANILVTLSKTCKGRIMLYDMEGKLVISHNPEIFRKGSTKTTLNTGDLNEGIYYYKFISDEVVLSGKLVISR